MLYVNFEKELRMLPTVTLNCQVTKIVMNSGSTLSLLGWIGWGALQSTFKCKHIKCETMRKNISFQELPEVAEKLTPTLIEIRKDIQGDAEISDEKFSKWGRSLVMEGKPFAK